MTQKAIQPIDPACYMPSSVYGRLDTSPRTA